MARNLNFSRPKNTKKTLLQLLAYLAATNGICLSPVFW